MIDRATVWLYRVIKKGDYEAQTLDDYIGTEVELNCGYAELTRTTPAILEGIEGRPIGKTS
jgi:hypothetical protein